MSKEYQIKGENQMLEIDSIITNGYVDASTIEHFTSKGWTFICTIPAKSAHPYAMPTDKLSIFSKYTELVVDESKSAEGNNAN